MKAVLRVVAASCAAVVLSAIAHPQPVRSEEAPTAPTVVKTYGDMAEVMYGDALAGAEELRTAVQVFLDKPDAETLDVARKAWRSARVPYTQTEGYRFGNRIVDDWEGRVNAWPVDEGLIDYVDVGIYGETKTENPLYGANVIASTSLQVGADKIDTGTIDRTLIRKLHEALGVEANVASGYHAIEFLLWGQDLNGTGPGAGNRPATDYDVANCTGGNCDRRRAYLKTVSELLVDDLAEMANAWKPDGAARKALAAKGPDGGLAAILTGLGSLSYGELAGERVKLGVLLHDPEEEQDCFSDDTHNSHYNNQVGMLAIWNGRYQRPNGEVVEGLSLADLARIRFPEAAKRVDDTLARSLAMLKDIKAKADSGEMAYDQMLGAGNEVGNKMLFDAVDALVAQTRALEGIVSALKLKIELEGSDSLDHPDRVGRD